MKCFSSFRSHLTDKNLSALLTVAAVLLMLGSKVSAHELSVGRVKVTFPSQEWRALEVSDKGLDYGGDIRGTIKSETKIFWLESSERLDAFIIARGSSAGISDGYMNYSPECKSEGTLHSDGNTQVSSSYAQCMKVFPLINTMAVLNSLPKDQQALIKQARDRFPINMQPITAYYANSTGTFLHFLVMLAPDTLLDKDALQSDSSKAMREERSIAWSKELMKVVKGSVTSISGRLNLPSFPISPKTVSP
jgi:hypothetical protein